MSSKAVREERKVAKHLPVTSRCLAIVLSPKTTTKADEDNVSGDNSTSQHNGKELLEDFKLQNKTCYWNPALIESIRALEYLGFVAPCTILVGGEEIHLENLRSAWGRRVLKGPLRYNIERIGDVSGIEMQEIPQTQFIPLPDALCLIILELNQARVLATLDTVREKLSRWYRHTSQPPDSLLYDTLSDLIRERKVFHNGSGYFVVTPDTFRLATEGPNFTVNASWLPYHPLYIPVFPQHLTQHTAILPARAPMRSISTQANMESQDKAPAQTAPAGKARHSRSNSVRGGRSQSKSDEAGEGEDLKRTVSVRYSKADKTKASIKDANLKTSNINQEKEKGEKVSLLSKLFGRNKKKAAAPPPPPPVKEVEYATFSAQFPPPEWLWYQQQQEKQRRTEEWVSSQMAKSGHAPRHAHLPATGVEGKGGHSGPLMRHIPPGGVVGEGGQGERKRHSHQGGGRIRDSFHGAKSRRDKVHPGDDRRLSGHYHGDVSKMAPPALPPPQHHSVDGGGSGGTPVLEENIYQSVSSPTNHPTPPKNPPPPAERHHHYDSITVEEQGEDTRAMASHELYPDRFNPHHAHTHTAPHPRAAHRSKRRMHRQSYLPLEGNDISMEYKGKLPKRNSSFVQSRESGVNCVGLVELGSPDNSAPKYTSTPHAASRHHHFHHEVAPQSSHGQREIISPGLSEIREPREASRERPCFQEKEDHRKSEGQTRPKETCDSTDRDNSSTPAMADTQDSSLEKDEQDSKQQVQAKPEIIVDNEPHYGCYDPDVARSRPQSLCESQGTGGSTLSESERSVETVIPARRHTSSGSAARSGDTLGGELRELSLADSGISSPRLEDAADGGTVPNGGKNQGQFFSDVHNGHDSGHTFPKHCHARQPHRASNGHAYGFVSETHRESIVIQDDRKHRRLEVGKDNYVLYDDRRYLMAEVGKTSRLDEDRLHPVTEAGKENLGGHEDRKHRSKSLHRGEHQRSDHVLNNQRLGRGPKLPSGRSFYAESGRPREAWTMDNSADFQHFRQQQTLAAKHFDLNGDFEVVGVV